MKFAIVGTGGVGGYFGGKLAAAGYDVTFIARGAHLKAIKDKGLTVKSINGDFVVSPAKATDSISEVGVVDVVFVCLKAWQVAAVAAELKPLVGADTVVIPLQNGVMATDELRKALGTDHAVRGLCRIFSKKEDDGVINHFGIEPTIIFGEDSNLLTPRILKIKEALEKAGVKVIIPKDIEAEAWKKFLFICSSGLLAVMRSPYGVVREIPQTRQMLYDLFVEIYQVAIAKGVHLNPEIVDKTMAMVDTFDYNTTSSLTRDVMEGKPSEIDYQNGTVVRMGEMLGVAAPVNKFIYDCIIPMELKARGFIEVEQLLIGLFFPFFAPFKQSFVSCDYLNGVNEYLNGTNDYSSVVSDYSFITSDYSFVVNDYSFVTSDYLFVVNDYSFVPYDYLNGASDAFFQVAFWVFKGKVNLQAA